MPVPDEEVPSPTPGAELIVCEWRVTYDAKQERSWLRIEAELKYSHFVGITEILVVVGEVRLWGSQTQEGKWIQILRLYRH